MAANNTWLSAATGEKPVPTTVRVSPGFGATGATEVTEGTARFGFARTENNASTRQSPMLVTPFKFRSPTVFGNAGLLIPPTVSAHASASPMLTLRFALMSPRSRTLAETPFDTPAGDTAVIVTGPGVVNCAMGTDAVRPSALR